MAVLKEHLHLLQSWVEIGWTPSPAQDMILSVEEWYPSHIIPGLTERLIHHHFIPYNITSDQGVTFYNKASSTTGHSHPYKSLDLTHAPVPEASW